MLNDNQIISIVGWPTKIALEQYREIAKQSGQQAISHVAKWLAATAPQIHQAFLDEFPID